MREGNESKLTLIGTSGNAPRSISFSGPWAQFRLFGAGQLTGVQDGNFTVRFSVDGGAMTYRVHTTRKITRSAVGCSASLVCQAHCTEEAGMNSNVLTQTIVTGSDPRGCRNSAPSARK